MKKNLITAVAVLVMAVGVPLVPGHAQKSDKPLKALMMCKLTNSEKILEGLTLNDFDKVSKHAENLIEISKAVEWQVLKTPDYELYSNQFRRNCQSLIKQAKAKNTDGVALAYVDMTLTCVKCHQHVREVRMARLDEQPDANSSDALAGSDAGFLPFLGGMATSPPAILMSPITSRGVRLETVDVFSLSRSPKQEGNTMSKVMTLKSPLGGLADARLKPPGSAELPKSDEVRVNAVRGEILFAAIGPAPHEQALHRRLG